MGPHPSTEFRVAAAAALDMAQRNLRAADRSARAGEIRIASADIVAGLEEVAKARIYFAADEELITFDPSLAKTRPYVPLSWLANNHGRKFSLLCCLAIAQVCGQFSVDSIANEDSAWAAKLDSDPKRFLQETYPELTAIFDHSGKFEALRQGRYSGTTTRGKPIPALAQPEYDRLRAGIGRMVALAATEQASPRADDARSELLREAIRPVLQATLKEFKDRKVRQD
jgi:hypothetical protein